MGEHPLQALLAQLYDNWPAFVYILLMILFSICFFLDRRAEKRAADQVRAEIIHHIERLEALIKGHSRQ